MLKTKKNNRFGLGFEKSPKSALEHEECDELKLNARTSNTKHRKGDKRWANKISIALMPPRVRLLEAFARGFWPYRETKSCGGFGGNPPIPPAFAMCPASARAPPKLDRHRRSHSMCHISSLRPAPPDLTDVDHWMVLILQV